MAEIKVEIEVKGLNELIQKLGRATAQETLEPVMMQGALLLQGWSQRNRFIGGGGKGKSKFGGAVQPDILTSRSGLLRGSITITRSIKRDEYVFFIGTNVAYGRIHEFGGYAGRKKAAYIPPRPFLKPAIQNQENINSIVKLVNKNIEKALQEK